MVSTGGGANSIAWPRRRSSRAVAAARTAFSICAALPAQPKHGTITIPNGFASAEANSSTNLPWGYGAFIVLWLIAARLAPSGASRSTLAIGLLAWALFSVSLPLPYGPSGSELDAVYGLVGVAVALGFAADALIRSNRVA